MGLAGAFLFSAFIVYGSVFPFDWQAIPGLGPWDALLTILRDDGTRASRIDFATNVMLSIPVAFCLMAALRARWHARDLGLALMVLLWCLLLGALVETAQVYVPGRVPSRFDILAQGLGALVGLSLWAWRGEWLWSSIFDWSPFNEQHGGWRQAANLYLVAMFAYGLLPLDLTINPFDLYAKWKQGMVHLVPLHQLAQADGRVAYQLASLLLLWGLAAWLLRKGYGLSAGATVTRTTALAVVLEVLQLFVFSRSTDSTDILMAALAASAVALFAPRSPATSSLSAPARPSSGTAGVVIVLMLLGSLLTLALSWYPFERHPDPDAWRASARGWIEIPLAAFFNTDPLQAGTTFLQKALLFAPWGALAAWARGPRRRGLRWLVLVYAFGLMLVVELGKLFLFGKVSNPINIGFELFGMWMAYWWVRTVRGARAGAPLPASSARAPLPTAPVPLEPAAQHRRVRRLWSVLLPAQLLLTGLVLALLGQVEALPYNLRAVLNGRNLLQWLCLAAAISLMVLPWAWLGGLPSRKRRGYWWVWLVQPLLLFVLLRLGAPTKQVFNVIGTPSFGWPWEIEAALRFAVLNLLLAWGIYSTHRWLDRPAGARRDVAHVVNWAFATLVVMLLWHAVVVGQAVTDNLVELMYSGGTWWTTPLIFAWWGLLYTGALLLGQALVGRRPPRVIALVPVLGVAAYLLLDLALEPLLVKYGKAFSAWQFLLSADRANYADPMGLLLRYAAAHATVTLGLVWCMLPTLLARRHAPALGAAQTRRGSRRPPPAATARR